ncbi:MAG: response regulator [Ignavibacteriaceae bacterium]|nr:response regulator [Ignavibacteriaceae bacterium]
MDEYRVLIVDDEEELVTTIAERLQIRGIQTQTATDGETALKMIEVNPPQVVVLDVMMPGMGGIEVLQRMKAQNLKIPVILLTGYGSTEQGMEGMKLGAFDYLMKPCDLNNLISKIQEAVKNL